MPGSLLSFLYNDIVQSLHWNIIWLYSVSPCFVRYLWQTYSTFYVETYSNTSLPQLVACNCKSIASILFGNLLKTESLSDFLPVKDTSLLACLLDCTVNFLQAYLIILGCQRSHTLYYLGSGMYYLQ